MSVKTRQLWKRKKWTWFPGTPT